VPQRSNDVLVIEGNNVVRIGLGVLAAASLAAILIAPAYMFAHAARAETITAYGQWIGDFIVAAAAVFAIYQLTLSKKSSETEAFLRICDMVDERTFLLNYNYVLSHRDELHDARVSKQGLECFKASGDYDQLHEAVFDVLYQLEKIGILVHHSVVNKKMIVDYIGEVVVNAHGALSTLILFFQLDDKDMYERLVELNKTCLRHGWKPRVAEKMRPTGL